MVVRIGKPSSSDFVRCSEEFGKKSLSKFKNELRKKKEKLLVLKTNNKLAGVIKFKNLKNGSRIESFFIINKNLRRRGLGQKLYDNYEKSLKGKKFVELYVYLANRKAQNFYKKNGFRIIKSTKDDAGKKMYYMKKKLG